MASLYTSVQKHLDERKSTTKLVLPEHPDFEALQAHIARKPSVQPVFIARPQNANDVQILVKYCAQNEIEYVVCTGGHDRPGGIEGQKIIWIDMRDIDYLEVAEDRRTVRVGGGILFRGLEKSLIERGLTTPAAILSSAGYIGWATLGAYGPFSALYGLGTDQIVNAKAVNYKGEFVEMSNESLDSITGRGGMFGVIVELTFEVYILKEMVPPDLVEESDEDDA